MSSVGIARVQFFENVLTGPLVDPYSASMTLSLVPQQNNVLVMAVSFDAGIQIPQTASITQIGVSWNLIHRTLNVGVVLGTELWYGIVEAGASPTIAMVFNPIIQLGAFHGCIVQIAEYSGLRVVNPLDKYAWANGDVQLVANPTSGTTEPTTQNEELWIAVIETECGYPQTNPTNGFTQLAGQTLQPGGFWSVSFFERIVTTIGQASVSTTLQSNGFYLGNIATFAAVTPSGGTKTFGDAIIRNTRATIAAGQKVACRFSLFEAGSLQKITAYMGSDGMDMYASAAVYSDNDGVPGTLIGSTLPSIISSYDPVWVDFLFSVSINLAAGYYWLCFRFEGMGPSGNWNYHYYYDVGAINQSATSSSGYGGTSWESSFGVSMYASDIISVYATYAPLMAPVTHQLAIILMQDANLTDVSMKIDSGAQFLVNVSVPYLIDLLEGVHAVEAITPALGSDEKYYDFVNWENGSTNPVRTVNLLSNAVIQATYKLRIVTGMKTFGDTVVRGINVNISAGLKVACRFNLSEAGSVQKITAYLGSDGTDMYATAAIYSDNGGAPDSLIGSTSLSSPIPYNPVWVDFMFISPINIPAGYYWLCFRFENTGASGNWNYHYYYGVGAVNQLVTGMSGYGGLPWESSFGVPTYASETVSVYASYTPLLTPIQGLLNIHVFDKGVEATVPVLVDGTQYTAPIDNPITLSAGSHSVSCSTYNVSQSFSIVAGQVTTVNLYYVPPTYSLTVNSSPSGVSFSISGISMSYVTPTSLSLDAGTYEVNMPANVSVGSSNYVFAQWENGSTSPTRIIVLNASASITAIYQIVTPPPTQGILNADTTPVKGLVFVDGVSRGTAPISLNLNLGTYNVSFGDVSGYVTPTGYTATIVAGQTTTVLGTYTLVPPPTQGTLNVDTVPVKGSVIVDGVNQGIASISIALSPGTHNVAFGVVSGYATASGFTVNIVAGQTTSVLGIYTVLPPAQGVLLIDTTPVYGEVFVDGVSWGIAPQSKVLDVGVYTISFGSASGYITPASQIVTIIANLTMVKIGVYVALPPPKGTLNVDATPIRGQVFVNGVLQGIAPILVVLDPGFYTVTFGPILGYTTPSPFTVSVVQDQVTSVIGTYAVIPPPPPQKGKLTIETTPFGTKVYVNDVLQGVTPIILDVDPGSYTISFEVVAGYKTPDTITVSVEDGKITSVVGVYVLTVSTTPWYMNKTFMATLGAVGVGVVILSTYDGDNSKKRRK